MVRHDPNRVLREYGLEPLRRELQRLGRVLSVTGGSDVRQALAVPPASCAGAWIEIDDAEGLHLAALAEGVARALRAGGRLCCVVPGGVGFTSFRRAFEPAVAWRRSSAFGVLLPSATVWPRSHPLMLALRAATEHVIRRWPLVRTRGDWILHEGVRR